MAQQRRVLLLAPCFKSPVFGGVQRSGEIAWTVLNSTGAQLVSYSSACDSSCKHSKVKAAADVLAAAHRTDLVVVWHLGVAKLLPLAGMRHEKIAVFLHGVECWRRLDRVTRWALRGVKEFWSNSAFTWKKFTEANPEFRGRTHVVVALGDGNGLSKFAAPQGSPSAVIIGRMDSREGYKGHRELIEAWTEVRKMVPEARLDVIGGGSLKAELETLVDTLHLRGAVRFHGILPEAEKLELIKESRCLLMPSRGEGFGLVYLEAMRLGRPCLVSREDAGHEVVNPPEAGLAVDPRDSGELTKAVVRLMSDGDEWNEWAHRARVRYEARYTAEQFQVRLLKAVDGLYGDR